VADPVSWMVIEEGWSAVARGGEELGTVDEVLGDEGADIFDGLTVSPGRLRRPRYVPAELVGRIVENRVQIDVAPHEFDRLPEYDGSPPSSASLAELLATFGRAGA